MSEKSSIKQKFVLLGNVDSGKSTLGGQILISTNHIDEREIEKVKKEADSRKMSSWWLAYLLDSDESERERGKTHDYFTVDITYKLENDKKEHPMMLIDAPGHKQLISQMTEGCSQANIALLILSARSGEYESGLSGQTIEHCVIARGMGISTLVVVINKMDTVDWDQVVYDKIKTDFEKKIKKYRFKELHFLPISAYEGVNIAGDCQKNLKEVGCDWYQGKSLMETLATVSYKEIQDNTIIVGDRSELVVKFLPYQITGVFSAGIQCKIHTKDKVYDAKIILVLVKNEKTGKKYKFLTKENDPKNFIDVVFKCDKLPKEIHSNLIIRNGDRTIGIGKIVKSI